MMYRVLKTHQKSQSGRPFEPEVTADKLKNSLEMRNEHLSSSLLLPYHILGYLLVLSCFTMRSNNAAVFYESYLKVLDP